MKGERIAGITILTTCLYALSMYMQKGTWIFPFPLYETGLFAAAILVFLAHRTELRWTDYVACCWTTLQFLKSGFLLEFLLNEDQMIGYYESPLPDLLQLLFYTLFAVWIVGIALRKERQLVPLIGGIAGLVFIGLSLANLVLLAIIPLVTWAVLSLVAKIPERERAIILIFTFFYCSKELTLYLLAS